MAFYFSNLILQTASIKSFSYTLAFLLRLKKTAVKMSKKIAPTETDTRVSGLMNMKIMITTSETIAK